jgi:protein-tyrosine-phosphatase
VKKFVLLFVCTGNICRSPMAEGIMKDLLMDEAANHRIIPVEIVSAGIQALEGQPASRFSKEVAAEHGINLNFHKSKPLSLEIAKNADLVLTMEKFQTDYIISHFPEVELVYELKNYPDNLLTSLSLSDIPDPIGRSIEVYRAVFDELKHELDRISKIIFPLILKTYDLL